MTDLVNITQSSRRDILYRVLEIFLTPLVSWSHAALAIKQLALLVFVRFGAMLHFSVPFSEICKMDRKPPHYAKGGASKPLISLPRPLPPAFLHFCRLFPSNEGQIVVNYNPVQKDQVYIGQLQQAVCEENGFPLW